MNPDLFARLNRFIGAVAAQRPGELRKEAVRRAATELACSPRIVRGVLHGEDEVCSDRRAEALLAQRDALLAQRLAHSEYLARHHAAETARLRLEIEALKDAECQPCSGAGSPSACVGPPNECPSRFGIGSASAWFGPPNGSMTCMAGSTRWPSGSVDHDAHVLDWMRR